MSDFCSLKCQFHQEKIIFHIEKLNIPRKTFELFVPVPIFVIKIYESYANVENTPVGRLNKYQCVQTQILRKIKHHADDLIQEYAGFKFLEVIDKIKAKLTYQNAKNGRAATFDVAGFTNVNTKL